MNSALSFNPRSDMKLTGIERIRNLCHHFKIKNYQDAMWMEEFSWHDMRFDVLTVDLFTWAVRGFEIKMTRQDFLADKKWHAYLPYVNFFYFATMPGVIEKGELPPEIGWLELGESGFTVRQKAKPLQEKFVRETYGEQFVTRVFLEYIRNVCWRESRIYAECECGKRMEVKDGRFSKTGTPYQISLP